MGVWVGNDGNIKSALHACDNALNKFPGHESILALKAISLQRLEWRDESVAICDQLLSRPKLKEETMFHMELALKGMGQHQKVAKIYEKAHKGNPNDPELQRKLFSSYVSCGDTVRQQQMALKLYKASGGKNEKFLFWAVASLVLQYEYTQKEHFLLIAKTMVEKHAAHSRLQLADSLVLFIEILSKLKMWDTALDTLSENGERLIKMDYERKILEIDLFRAGGRLDRAKESLEAYLIKSPDDWNALLKLMDIVIPLPSRIVQFENLSNHPAGRLQKEGTESTAEGPSSSLMCFLDNLNEETKARPGHVTRGPQLALCEVKKRMILQSRKHEDGKVDSIVPELVDRIVDYWSRFGSLACCPLDLSPYCRILHPASATALKEKMSEAFPLVTDDLTREEALKFEASMLQIEYLSGYVANLEPENILSWAKQVMAKYEEATSLIGPRDPREFDFADVFPSLAAGSLVQCCRKFYREHSTLDSFACLVSAILNLRTGVDRAPFNAEMQLALCGLYGILNCLRDVEKAWNKLEIKHVQYESVASHHLLPLLTSSCSTSGTKPHLKRLLEFHEGQVQNIGDSISQAMEDGNFSKAIEFWKFSERLKASFNLAAAKSEQVIAQTRKALETMLASGRCELNLRHEDIVRGDKAAFRFNDDLQTRPDWLPPPSSWCYAKAEIWGFLQNPDATWSWWEDIESPEQRMCQHREALVRELHKSQLAHASVLRTFSAISGDNSESARTVTSVDLQELCLQDNAQVGSENGTESWSSTAVAIEEIMFRSCTLAEALSHGEDGDVGLAKETSDALVHPMNCVFTYILDGLVDTIGVFSRALSVGPSFLNGEVLYLVALLNKYAGFKRKEERINSSTHQSCGVLITTLYSQLQALKAQLTKNRAERKGARVEIASLVKERVQKACTTSSFTHLESVMKSIVDERNTALDELCRITELRLRQIQNLAVSST